MANMRRTLVRGSVKDIEYTLLRADGSEFHAELSTSLVKNASGNPTGFIAVTRDITDRKKVEDALRQSEERYRSLVQDTRAGIACIDLQGKFTFVNRALCEMTGYLAEELLGRPFADFLHPDDRAGILRLFAGYSASGRPVLDLEFGVAKKSGHFIDMCASATPIKSNGGTAGFSAIITDITERKHAEERLLAYQRELRSLAAKLSLAEERERRRIARAVHDRISQALALCRIKPGALMESAPSALAEPLGEIHDLVVQLIAEARSLTHELGSPLLYELGLGAAVERLTEETQERHGILIDFEDDGKPKQLDEHISVLLFQAVRELLVNIVKHAQAHRAKVSIKRDRVNLLIIVEDDGIGFDTSDISPRRKRTKGFGLFSIRERLHPVDGHMEIRSERGRGTRVSLLLPLKHRANGRVQVV
jgi:PAS domain S-box-containing protein